MEGLLAGRVAGVDTILVDVEASAQHKGGFARAGNNLADRTLSPIDVGLSPAAGAQVGKDAGGQFQELTEQYAALLGRISEFHGRMQS